MRKFGIHCPLCGKGLVADEIELPDDVQNEELRDKLFAAGWRTKYLLHPPNLECNGGKSCTVDDLILLD